jgi:hypothetical protein
MVGDWLDAERRGLGYGALWNFQCDRTIFELQASAVHSDFAEYRGAVGFAAAGRRRFRIAVATVFPEGIGASGFRKLRDAVGDDG